MSDRDLAAAAWAEFTKTTDSYPGWVKKGRPATSHWAKGKALLDQIDVTAPVGVRPPGSVPADGSADAAAALLGWLATVPDGATVDFGTGVYRVDSTLELRGRSLTLAGDPTFRQTLPPDDQRPFWRFIGCTISVPGAMKLQGSYVNGGVLTDGLQHAHGFDCRVVTVQGNVGAAGGSLVFAHVDGLAVSGNSGVVSVSDCTGGTA